MPLNVLKCPELPSGHSNAGERMPLNALNCLEMHLNVLKWDTQVQNLRAISGHLRASAASGAESSTSAPKKWLSGTGRRSCAQPNATNFLAKIRVIGIPAREFVLKHRPVHFFFIRPDSPDGRLSPLPRPPIPPNPAGSLPCMAFAACSI